MQQPVGSVVKCKQREAAALSPFLSRHHVPLVLSQTAGGFEEAVIASHVKLIAGVVQFQGLVRVFLALHQLFDAGESELLKGKRILCRVSVELGGLHQTHHQEIRRSILKRIVDLEQPLGGAQIVGPHFASHGGITHDAAVHGDRQIFVEVSVHLDLTQQQPYLHVGHVEAHGVRAPVPDGEEFRGVEEQLDADLHLGHQQFTQVEHLDHGFESQHVGLVHVIPIFLSHLLEGKLFRLGQGQMIGVGSGQLIGGELSDGRIQSVHPSLRFQDGLSVVSVKIQCRVQQGLVGVGVRLRTDKRVVESHADLLEQGVGKVVGQKDGGGGGGCEGGAIGFLQFQFQLEFALTQIDVFRLRIDLKVHRSDARGERVDGYLASTGDAKVRRRDLEQVQHGRHDGLGTRNEGCRTHDDDGALCLSSSARRNEVGDASPESFNVARVVGVSADPVALGVVSARVSSGEGPPSPCRESWGLRPTTILPTEADDVPSENRWDSSYPKRSLTARFAAPLARFMAELAFRFTPRLAPRLAHLFTPRMPAKRLGSPNGPPLFNDFQPSLLASAPADDATSLKTLPRYDPMPPPPWMSGL